MRILKELNPPADVQLQDIKAQPITAKQLDKLAALAGNYEALFSKRAKLYSEMGLKHANLKEADFKHYILEHYTFLKRPVIVINEHIFIGNSTKTIAAAKKIMND